MQLCTFLLVLAGSCVALAHLRAECPPQESIIMLDASCSCFSFSGSEQGSSIRCNSINTFKAFQDILKTLKGYKVNYLLLSGLRTSMLSAGLFQGLHIVNLQLYGVVADEKSLGHSHFLGLENSLEDVSMYLVEGSELLSAVKLDHLHSLKNVEFSNLKTKEFGNDWFKGPENFEFFIASDGELEKLGDKAFASQANLKILTLSYNNLEEISRSMLPNPANHLKVLNLGDNKIRTLPSDIFSGMPALTRVILQNNLIQTLPEDTWSPVFYRMRTEYLMAFVGNPLRCDQDLKWACKVNVKEFGETKCASPDDKRGVYVKHFCKV